MNSPLDQRIKDFGQKIFEGIGQEKPSVFSKNHLSSRMMEWSLKRPDFKVNMFRLIDVLPSLKRNQAIAAHIREYLSEPAKSISFLAEWGLQASRSVLGHVAAISAKKSVEQMAGIFIAGKNAEDALKALRKLRSQGLAFTVDLLGEFCVSEKEAEVYLNRYLDVLSVFGEKVPSWPESQPIISGNPGCLSPFSVSVKLTALYSQCRAVSFGKSVEMLSERLTVLARKAREVNALLCVDAEDSSNNVIIFEAFKRVFGSKEFSDWEYPGIAVQAYDRNSEEILKDLIEFAKRRNVPIAVRLVKGAYWDYETIVSNQNHWPHPLYTEKEDSDANYEKLTRLLLDNSEHCFSAFGSHNIRSLAHACCYAESKGLSSKDFELQMLYGMAEPIAKAFARQGYLTRMYVPLGEMLPGMGYFVRRLLENTSNESFLKHTFADASEISSLLSEPQFSE